MVSSNRDAVNALVGAASEWIDAALRAWSENRPMQATALAPLAVEQVAKAALWRVNPVLLAPLERQHESSFLKLASSPDLRDPRLRTIGLREVLTRVGSVVDSECPIPDKRVARLVDCRNGAIHVGHSDKELARHVLTDALSLLRWLLPATGYAESAFHHRNMDQVNGLLDQRKSEMERIVADAVASARRDFAKLKTSTGHRGVFESTVTGLEARAEAEAVGTFLPDYMIEHRCPACGSRGWTRGVVALIPGTSEDPWDPNWDVVFTPHEYRCWVCSLALLSQAQMAAAGLDGAARTLDDGNIRFDVDRFASDLASDPA